MNRVVHALLLFLDLKGSLIVLVDFSGLKGDFTLSRILQIAGIRDFFVPHDWFDMYNYT